MTKLLSILLIGGAIAENIATDATDPVEAPDSYATATDVTDPADTIGSTAPPTSTILDDTQPWKCKVRRTAEIEGVRIKLGPIELGRHKRVNVCRRGDDVRVRSLTDDRILIERKWPSKRNIESLADMRNDDKAKP